MLVVAAAVGGAGVSRVIWPSGQASSIAAQGGSSTPTSPVPSYGNSGSGNTSEGSGGPSDVGVIAAKVDPALVDVNSIFNYDEAEGAGTGIVLTSTGEILTNNHVVDGATKISVTDVGNGKTYLATVVGYDNTHDVAVLQLQGASGLQTAKLGDSTRLSVGEAVVAIGNAGGAGGTPTSAGGSVTGLGQSITASDGLTGTSEQLSGLIEVNANVESGDSGGPLVNASGQVVGMDTAAEQGFSFQASGNQGFAIPIDQALAIARQIVAGSGSSTVHVGPTGFLGLLVHTPSNSSGLFGNTGSSGGQQYPNVAGAEISGVVSGGPAAKAGVVAGDVITSFDGQTLSSGSDLTHLLVPHHPGDKVELGWVDSSGQSHTAMVQLASGPPA
jgi:S1-C subfamily serine protease